MAESWLSKVWNNFHPLIRKKQRINPQEKYKSKKDIRLRTIVRVRGNRK
jgi:hypothetical protein